MTISKTEFDKYIKECRHETLFNVLGWDKGKDTPPPVKIGGDTFHPRIIAEKRGFQIISCDAENIPVLAIRLKIANKLKTLYQKNIVIFTNKSKREQVWLHLYRRDNHDRKVDVRYVNGQDTERIYQRASGLIFELDEQDNITIVDVSKRVSENFVQNTEKVTKKFYDNFKKQHIMLLKFIKGIKDTPDREWYASIILNRLMFCYFMQRRRFLNNDRDYLRNKLNECKAEFGKDKFYSFYRNFLRVLFEKGFGTYKHSRELKKMIGSIPYLNGGLFDIHEVERKYPDINISDEAFKNIFDFFDTYEWHLDSRDCATGNEISPDVLGYIFEKYINDRAKMGAYYTREDITDYISRNSILPYLLESAKTAYPQAFEDGGAVWGMLKDSGGKYIFDSVKKGAGEPLPENIAAGLDTQAPDLLKRRENWNKTAPEKYALPTETWREVIERKKRYEDVSSLIKKGKITEINDFITYNLDITNFAVDLLDNVEDPKFIQEFYKNLQKITVLDPTCGSGAFLFAALNILEPLYDSCLNRMSDYLSHDYKGSLERGIKKFFEDSLKLMNSEIHPSKQYFIYKSIILNNLYGVDIMREAVETAKLRLFLKLVSTADPDYKHDNIGIEPLPDIDFNIKAGNTLVGIANQEEIKKAIFGELFGASFENQIKTDIKDVAHAISEYKNLQLGECGYNDDNFHNAKKKLIEKQNKLKNTLDDLLRESQYTGMPKEKWQSDYMPFHWVAEFYSIVVENKGFDVVIGNPPYVSMNKIDYEIKLGNFRAPDIYGYVINRIFQLMHKQSKHGFIVMHNLAFSKHFEDVRALIRSKANAAWFSFYARIPSGLFTGDVRVRNCIYILSVSGDGLKKFHTTRMHRWYSNARPNLFFKLNYVDFDFIKEIPMFFSQNLSLFYTSSNAPTLHTIEDRLSNNSLFFKQSAYNWISISEQPAPCYDISGNEIQQTQVKEIKIANQELALLCLLLFNGKMFYSYWLTYGDEFHVTKDDLFAFKIKIMYIIKEDKKILMKLVSEFQRKINDTIQYKLNAGKNVGTYNTAMLWDITDKSDKIFIKYIQDDFNTINQIVSDIDNHVNLTCQSGETDDNED